MISLPIPARGVARTQTHPRNTVADVGIRQPALAAGGQLLVIFMMLISISASQAHARFSDAATGVQPAPLGTRFVAQPAGACTRYVALTGNDDGAGSDANPWRTLQHAADSARPGDTVCVRAGAYMEEDIRLKRSGTADAPIAFVAAPGETVTLGGQDGILLERGVSYIEMRGFTITGFRIAAIWVTGDSRHLRFSGLDVTGGEGGIHFTEGDSGQPPAHGPVSDVILEDSTFRDGQYTAVDCTPGPCERMTFRRLELSGFGLAAGFGGDGLGVERGREILVEDSYIHDNGGDGIDLNSRDVDGNVPGIVVRRNRVERNQKMGIKLWSGGRIENNVVWGQGLSPVLIGIHPGAYEVVNNTVAYNLYDPAFSERDYALVAGYPQERGAPALTLTLVNNIFAFNTGPQVGSPTGIYLGPGVRLTEHHNLYWSRADGEIQAAFVTGRDEFIARAEIAGGVWTAISGQGAGDVTADPLFVAGWPTPDLRLQPGSPAIGAGSAADTPTHDADGQPRDGAADIGASAPK